jgi:hypothetical protein
MPEYYSLSRKTTEVRRISNISINKGILEKVGLVLYIAIILRLDIVFITTQLLYFLINPSPEYISIVN